MSRESAYPNMTKHDEFIADMAALAWQYDFDTADDLIDSANEMNCNDANCNRTPQMRDIASYILMVRNESRA